MICNVFRQSRKVKGKRVYQRLWWGQYRLEEDKTIKRVPLHTPDKQVAREKLNKIVRQVQLEREGLVAPAPMRKASSMTVTELGELYASELDELGRDDHYVKISGDRIRRLSKECGWKHLRDVTATSFQQWRARQKTSPKTVNDYLATLRSFFRWMMKRGMVSFDPSAPVERVEERGRQVRLRRAFTVEEVNRLLQVAPIERRRFYLTAYYTGLRRSELENLQWGDVHMDEGKPYIGARAATTKNKQDARLPIRPELLEVLRAMRPEGPQQTISCSERSWTSREGTNSAASSVTWWRPGSPTRTPKVVRRISMRCRGSPQIRTWGSVAWASGSGRNS